jgi:hypothetical protein
MRRTVVAMTTPHNATSITRLVHVLYTLIMLVICGLNR